MITKLHGESELPDPVLIDVLVRSHQHSVMFQPLLVYPGLAALTGVPHCPPAGLVKPVEAAGPEPVLGGSPGAGTAVRVAGVVTEHSPPHTALRVGTSVSGSDSGEYLEGGVLPTKHSVILSAPAEA